MDKLSVLRVALAVAVAVARLHQRGTDWLRGRPVPFWFGPTTAVICVGVFVFVVAWIRQI